MNYEHKNNPKRYFGNCKCISEAFSKNGSQWRNYWTSNKMNSYSLLGNSMSNNTIFLDVDTLTSQILIIFSPFVDNVEIINSWKFQPQTPYSSKVNKIWKFDTNGCSGVKSAILNLLFCNNYCSSHPFILKFGMGKFFGVRNPKSHLEDLKIDES